MDPFIAEIREMEREAYRAYERKLKEYFDAKDKLKYNGLFEEDGMEEVNKLYLAQWAAWGHFKSVQRDCRRMEWEWQNRPQVGKEPL